MKTEVSHFSTYHDHCNLQLPALLPSDKSEFACLIMALSTLVIILGSLLYVCITMSIIYIHIRKIESGIQAYTFNSMLRNIQNDRRRSRRVMTQGVFYAAALLLFSVIPLALMFVHDWEPYGLYKRLRHNRMKKDSINGDCDINDVNNSEVEAPENSNVSCYHDEKMQNERNQDGGQISSSRHSSNVLSFHSIDETEERVLIGGDLPSEQPILISIDLNFLVGNERSQSVFDDFCDDYLYLARRPYSYVLNGNASLNTRNSVPRTV